VQEEIGLRARHDEHSPIEPHVGIAIDVTHATDFPTIDRKQEGIFPWARDGDLPRPNMNRRVVTGLFAAAKDKEIPYQVAANGRATVRRQ